MSPDALKVQNFAFAVLSQIWKFENVLSICVLSVFLYGGNTYKVTNTGVAKIYKLSAASDAITSEKPAYGPEPFKGDNPLRIMRKLLGKS